jgi:hypothetical protein
MMKMTKNSKSESCYGENWRSANLWGSKTVKVRVRDHEGLKFFDDFQKKSEVLR